MAALAHQPTCAPTPPAYSRLVQAGRPARPALQIWPPTGAGFAE
jgi:hypothetical protein